MSGTREPFGATGARAPATCYVRDARGGGCGRGEGGLAAVSGQGACGLCPSARRGGGMQLLLAVNYEERQNLLNRRGSSRNSLHMFVLILLLLVSCFTPPSLLHLGFCSPLGLAWRASHLFTSHFFLAFSFALQVQRRVADRRTRAPPLPAAVCSCGRPVPSSGPFVRSLLQVPSSCGGTSVFLLFLFLFFYTYVFLHRYARVCLCVCLFAFRCNAVV